MKKRIASILTAAVISATTLTTTGCGALALANNNTAPTETEIVSKEYPMTGIVIDIQEYGKEEVTVYVACANTNVFGFYAPISDCWDIGDLASCIAEDMGTENVHDDEIISAKYCGTPEQFQDIADLECVKANKK